MRNSRSNRLAALTLLLATAAGVSASAHRKDEYLQAARVAIDPDAVHLELDLTPGMSVAGDVLSTIDTDSNGSVSESEADAYARHVRGDVTLTLDDRSVETRIVERTFPAVEAVRQGEGTIRMRLSAALPQMAPGVHHIRFANTHRAGIGVYLANALVPASARVSITDQQRDVNQRGLDVAFLLHAKGATGGRPSPFLDLAIVLAASAVLWLARRLGSRRPLSGRARWFRAARP